MLDFLRLYKFLLVAIWGFLLSACSVLTPQQKVEYYSLLNPGAEPAVKIVHVSPETQRFAVELSAGVALQASAGDAVQTPDNLNWILRHYGPLFEGSDLTQLELWLSGQPRLYYNKFFEGHPGEIQFLRYYGGQQLPQSPSPVYHPKPGQIPLQDGPVNIVFSLHRVDYSSKYGGSVELLFAQKEDYEFELRSGGYIWDIRDWRILIYVRPYKEVLNGGRNYLTTRNFLHVEFGLENATGYKANAVLIPVDFEETKEELKAALDQLSRSIETDDDIDESLGALVHGKVHQSFVDDFDTNPGATDIIDAIEISDGVISPISHEGRPHVSTYFLLQNIHAKTEPGDEEIYVEGDRYLEISDLIKVKLGDFESIRLHDHESYGWEFWFRFPVEMCSGQAFKPKFSVWIYFTESDLEDDDEALDSQEVELECDALQDAATTPTGLPVVFADTTSSRIKLGEWPSEDDWGGYTFRTRVIVELR